ncbi:hypothetical protein BG011_004377 [Mortierella polycephala]|uniref:Tubulin-folding cofactor E n=1 Tax=Mortierella polycephala TaxID=41804 RepID=A0A9P6Q0L0_9FUNG|nr:hypothetical protein BG011_004377 [Mortierella polycephala]
MTSDVTMTEAAPPSFQLTVSQRIEVDNFRGTVRYFGPVPPTKGEWIGVEWDEKERGKHSGEHNGTQYFQCLFPGTGSFTRYSNKVHTGDTLLAILKERYVQDKTNPVEKLYLGESKIEVDVYDFERVKKIQSKLHMLQIVGLAHTNVAKAAEFEETQKECPEIQDLDLSSTLISTWQDVADICAPLSKLTILRLNRNRFIPLTSQPSFEYSFKNLRCIALNRVYFLWDEMALLEPSMPNLQILQIGFNLFTDLGKSDDSVPLASQKVKGFANLKELHLEGNSLVDWNQVLRLSQLPKLESLDLSENKIGNITAPQDASDFKQLTSLQLSDNVVDNWTSIDCLGLYSSLRQLWIVNNPFAQKSLEGQNSSSSIGSDTRTSLIARMGQIDSLNGSEITKKNRIDAELYYLKNVALSAVGMEPSAVEALHPRFEQLCQVHGRPDTSDESRKATSDILKDRLIAVTLVSKDTIEGPVKKSVQRNVLGTMTVKNVKNLAQKLLRIPAMRQKLVFLTSDPDYEGVKVTVPLEDDLRQISYYDVEEGEEIIVLDKAK